MSNVNIKIHIEKKKKDWKLWLKAQNPGMNNELAVSGWVGEWASRWAGERVRAFDC